jgi:hypothetical protein
MQDWLDIPLVGPVHEDVDEGHLDQWTAEIVDFIPIVVEGKIHLVKRDGLEVFYDMGNTSPIDGLYWHDRLRRVIVVNNGELSDFTSTYAASHGLVGGTGLLVNSPASFAEGNYVSDPGSPMVVVANGGGMVMAREFVSTTISDAQAPTTVSHVASIDKYILALDASTGVINFSTVDDASNWAALDFFGAESKFDEIAAIAEGYQEIIALGRQSVEFFANDGQTPFVRIPGSAQPIGTNSPQSLAMVGGAWMWLDDKRRLVRMNGRVAAPVSSPFDRAIKRYDSVEDARGYEATLNGVQLYILNFKSARQTLAYNPESNLWFKLGYWDTESGSYKQFKGYTYCYAREWNLHLFGDPDTGIIYKATASAFTDDGNPIRSLLRTGNISHGTYGTKRSDAVRLKTKRGVANADIADPQISMRRRIDGKGTWTADRRKSLGQAGQYKPFITWRRNGIYETCQYEFVHSDPSACSIMGAQEKITPLLR